MKVFDQRAIHLVPGGEAAQVLPVRFALDEPGVVITGGALEVGVFLLDVAGRRRSGSTIFPRAARRAGSTGTRVSPAACSAIRLRTIALASARAR